MSIMHLSTSQRSAPRWSLLPALRLLLAAAFVIVDVAIANQALAQKLCIPPAIGVPGLPGAPRWWDAADPANQPSHGFDPTDPQWDPRWRGAHGEGFGGGLAGFEDVRFKTLFSNEASGRYLYLTWFVSFDTSFSPQDTGVYVGLSPAAGGTAARVLRATFTADTGSASGASGSLGAESNPSPLTGGKWTLTLFNADGTPAGDAWFNSSGADAIQTTARAWANPVGNHQWAVNLRVPIDPAGTNGINIGNAGDFRIWFYVQPAAVISGGTIAYIPYTLPRSSGNVVTLVAQQTFSGLVFPATTLWAPAALQAPEVEAACHPTGISLASGGIGTTNVPNSKINLISPNTFFAAPTNNDATTAVAANIVKARFRIANWGSAVGDLTATSWSDIPGLASVTDTGGIPANGTGNITGAWTLTQAERCKFVGKSGVPTANPPIPGDPACPNQNPELELHQCILVSLSGAGVSFVRDSAARNMDFVNASTFERSAEINIAGLTATGPAAGRDVYLSLEIRNMPSFPTIGTGTAPRQQERSALSAVAIPQITPELVKTTPTYIVHAYYDTGEKTTLNGTTHPLLQPLTSFGYLVEHSGGFFGWQPRLDGATEVAPNVYKVTVPHGGAVKINTSINTIDLTTWWIWLILAAIVIIIALIIWLLRRLALA